MLTMNLNFVKKRVQRESAVLLKLECVHSKHKMNFFLFLHHDEKISVKEQSIQIQVL